MPRDVESALRERLSAGFAPTQDPTAEARVRKLVGTLEPLAPRPRPLPRRMALRFAAAAVLALAITSGIALYGVGSRRAADSHILDSAVAAVSQGGILHYRVSMTDAGRPIAVEERWVDTERQLARSESVVVSSGPDPGMRTTTLDRGSVALSVTRKVNGDVYAFESRSKVPFRDEVAEEVDRYRRAIESGDASVVRREVVAGIDTWRIETRERVWWRYAEKPDEQAVHITANVSVSDFAPVRILIGEGAHPWSREFSLFERLDQRSVPATLFELDIPAGTPVSRQRELAVEDLAIFRELPVWWLGREWRGLRINARLGYYEHSFRADSMANPMPAPPMGWPEPVRALDIGYGGQDGMLDVQVMQRIDPSLWWWFGKLEADKPPVPSKRVRIDARTTGVLFESAEFPPVLVFERDGATIVVSAANMDDPADAALEAARELRQAF